MTDQSDIMEIQEMLMHQDTQINDLSEMIITQSKEIEALRRTVSRLDNKINVMEEGADDAGGKALSITEQALANKPPHF